MYLVPKTTYDWITIAIILAIVSMIGYLIWIFIVNKPTSSASEGFQTNPNSTSNPIEVEEESDENIKDSTDNTNNTSNIDPELLAAVAAAIPQEETDISPTDNIIVPDRVLPTDDMIHLDPVVINSHSSVTSPNSTIDNDIPKNIRTTEREGFQGGSAGSVMFDKLRHH